MTAYKERRDSTDSDKENEFESLIQLPNNSNAFNYNQQGVKTFSKVCKEKILPNEESVNDSIRNLRESRTEENLDNLLTNLFNDDDRIIELPQPDEIGLASIPENADLPLSVCSHNNNKFFTYEPWQFSGDTEVEFEINPFQDVNPLEDQKELDGELSGCLEMEWELTSRATDVFLGNEISSLDEDIKTALESPASEDTAFLQDDISVDVDIGVLHLQDDLHQEFLVAGDQFEESLARYEEIKVEPTVTKSKSEDKKEDGLPGVRTRLGRKRKPGTVVELLVKSYVRKRNTRCRVGTLLKIV